jgi:hypothetical protein
MSRPLRIEFENALYHVTSRGDRREPIFLDDADRLAFVALIAQACTRFGAAEVPRPRRAVPQSLAHWLAACPAREAALMHVHRQSGLPMPAIARELGFSPARVSQLVP